MSAPTPSPLPSNPIRPLIAAAALVILGGVLAKGCLPTPADPLPPSPIISLPAEVQVKPGKWVLITAKSQGSSVQWVIPDGIEKLPEDLGSRVYLSADNPGRYTVYAMTAVRSSWWPWAAPEPAMASCTVVVGVPVPPVPPTPPTPPVPPAPPAPIPGDGLRVLMVYDAQQAISKEQAVILTSVEIRSYLQGKCPKVGSVPEFRILDKTADMHNAAKVWQDAMQRPRQSTPWIIVSDGKTGFEGPLPGNVADTLTLLKKFGG